MSLVRDEVDEVVAAQVRKEGRRSWRRAEVRKEEPSEPRAAEELRKRPSEPRAAAAATGREQNSTREKAASEADQFVQLPVQAERGCRNVATNKRYQNSYDNTSWASHGYPCLAQV